MRAILRLAWRSWSAVHRAVCLPFHRARARAFGARVDSSVIITGFPVIRVKKGAELTLRDGVIVQSSVSVNPVIGRRTTTLASVAPGAVLELGTNVGVSGVCIVAAREIRIGEGTIIGADAMVLDNDFHQPLPNWRWANSRAETAKPINIGRGCFIGTRAIVLKGVTIGDGSVVGAGAVVTCDVPAGHLAFGNPAQVRELPEQWRRQPPASASGG